MWHLPSPLLNIGSSNLTWLAWHFFLSGSLLRSSSSWSKLIASPSPLFSFWLPGWRKERFINLPELGDCNSPTLLCKENSTVYPYKTQSLTHLQLGLDPAALILNGLKSPVDQGTAQRGEVRTNTGSETNVLAHKACQTFSCSNAGTDLDSDSCWPTRDFHIMANFQPA